MLWDKELNAWAARISFNEKEYDLGVFDKQEFALEREEEAQVAIIEFKNNSKVNQPITKARLGICEADDCQKIYCTFSDHAKFCSSRCRYRVNKRKQVQQRISENLCPQCGHAFEKKTESGPHYCEKCVAYFKQVYDKKKTSVSKNLKNLVGKRFGRYKVIKLAERKNKRVYWQCLCDCGTVKDVLADNLISGKVKSCGCYRMDSLWQGMKARVDESRVEGVNVALLKAKTRTDNTSGIKGVTYYKQGNNWRAQLNVGGKVYLETGFATKEQAQDARKRLEEKYLNPLLEKNK